MSGVASKNRSSVYLEGSSESTSFSNLYWI